MSEEDTFGKEISEEDISEEDIFQEEISEKDISEEEISEEHISEDDIFQEEVSEEEISEDDISKVFAIRSKNTYTRYVIFLQGSLISNFIETYI